MKKILLMFLFGTMTMFSQTIKVKGVTLSYDKIKKIMTLTTTPKIMYTNDKDMDVKIEINKEFALRMTIGGVNYSISEPYFEHKGHKEEMFWCFTTTSQIKYKEIKKNYVYQFKGVKPGEEYILTVSNICDDKYVTNEQTMSIQIN